MCFEVSQCPHPRVARSCSLHLHPGLLLWTPGLGPQPRPSVCGAPPRSLTGSRPWLGENAALAQILLLPRPAAKKWWRGGAGGSPQRGRCWRQGPHMHIRCPVSLGAPTSGWALAVSCALRGPRPAPARTVSATSALPRGRSLGQRPAGVTETVVEADSSHLYPHHPFRPGAFPAGPPGNPAHPQLRGPLRSETFAGGVGFLPLTACPPPPWPIGPFLRLCAMEVSPARVAFPAPFPQFQTPSPEG